ncbi:MAG: YlbF family regulator [Clostridiales bacterium]|jgi:cell fate (sporulation/competence/biofilm development) regulator YlbF (YheA/YmcA/DUF963 family)|nr:YlbF family regulator [Clostridiales bacterium]
MTVYEKARELGEMILETKEGKRLYDAKFIYGGDDDAKKVLTEYMMYRNILRSKAGDGSISEEELKSEIQKLNVLGEKAKENAVVKELMDAEDKFNTLVNSVLNILKETVLKDEEESEGCTGSCSSCGGCH